MHTHVCESESVSCSVVSNSLWPHEISPPGSFVHGILQARISELHPLNKSQSALWSSVDSRHCGGPDLSSLLILLGWNFMPFDSWLFANGFGWCVLAYVLNLELKKMRLKVERLFANQFIGRNGTNTQIWIPPSQLQAFSSAQSKVVQAHMYQQVSFLICGKKWDSIRFKMIY